MMVENYPILTLLPPLLAIGLAIATRRVLISLGVGVLSAALLIAEFNPLETLGEVWAAFAVIFWEEGAVNTWYVYILVFLVLLGVIAAFIMMSGGPRALADWALIRGKEIGRASCRERAETGGREGAREDAQGCV